ncbi:hypothetical protein B5M09_001802 [Aphanomyces astaci]|uniref:PARP catalytic domain-containing protein n=1 Tax=Aphanomyces astaci TaxID=112090 RepID=A0A425D6Z8_APHAT|nr:hypothetical protein B5M09_001802 [Aphanomyces astaci]
MVVRLRLARWGRVHSPFYRIVAADARYPRDGRHLEILGTYNPLAATDGVKELRVNNDRVKYWLSVGAQPSDRVSFLLGLANASLSSRRHATCLLQVVATSYGYYVWQRHNSWHEDDPTSNDVTSTDLSPLFVSTSLAIDSFTSEFEQKTGVAWVDRVNNVTRLQVDPFDGLYCYVAMEYPSTHSLALLDHRCLGPSLHTDVRKLMSILYKDDQDRHVIKPFDTIPVPMPLPYAALGVDLEVVPKESLEYDLVATYLHNSKDHVQYEMKIQAVYRVMKEVALGTPNSCTTTNSRAQAEVDFVEYHSVLGVGSYTPSADAEHVLPDGAVIPLGALKRQNMDGNRAAHVHLGTGLDYNEYVIFNPAQTRMRFLVAINFCFDV